MSRKLYSFIWILHIKKVMQCRSSAKGRNETCALLIQFMLLKHHLPAPTLLTSNTQSGVLQSSSAAVCSPPDDYTSIALASKRMCGWLPCELINQPRSGHEECVPATCVYMLRKYISYWKGSYKNIVFCSDLFNMNLCIQK